MTTTPLKITSLHAVRDMRDQLKQVTYKSIPLYEGLLHAIVGEGESGKTWIAAHAVLDTVRRDGRALVLDGEMSAPAWKRRLVALGATEADLEQILYAEMTELVVDVGAVVETCDIVRAISLIVWDSALSMLSRVARSENDNAEVSRVYDRLREIVRRALVAGLIVDHTTRGSNSLVSRGATAKFNALDISYGVRVAEGSIPNPAEPWSSIISVEKDRHGLLGKRTDREASFFPLSAGGLDLSITERDSATHRLSLDSPVQAAFTKIAALDPPPTSANAAYKAIGGNRVAVLKAFKAWNQEQS